MIKGSSGETDGIFTIAPLLKVVSILTYALVKWWCLGERQTLQRLAGLA